MPWAFYGGGKAGAPNQAVRLHLGFHLLEDKPVAASVTPGATCERKAWRTQWQKGAAYVGDRYFGEDHAIYGELEAHGCAYLLRLRETVTITEQEPLPVSAAERAAGVTRQAWATLGTRAHRSVRLRVIWIASARGRPLILVTNLLPAQASADQLALVYRRRWQIELFFKWAKCVLKCGHWLAESPTGVTVQLYLLLIAALLLPFGRLRALSLSKRQLSLGRRPNRRMLELLALHQQGWATAEELEAGLARELAALAAKEKR